MNTMFRAVLKVLRQQREILHKLNSMEENQELINEILIDLLARGKDENLENKE